MHFDDTNPDDELSGGDVSEESLEALLDEGEEDEETKDVGGFDEFGEDKDEGRWEL